MWLGVTHASTHKSPSLRILSCSCMTACPQLASKRETPTGFKQFRGWLAFSPRRVFTSPSRDPATGGFRPPSQPQPGANSPGPGSWAGAPTPHAEHQQLRGSHQPAPSGQRLPAHICEARGGRAPWRWEALLASCSPGSREGVGRHPCQVLCCLPTGRPKKTKKPLAWLPHPSQR